MNPCGDPPGPPGTVLTPPTAEGGALRSQDLRTAGDPGDARRHGDPGRPGHRRRPAEQPARAARTPTRAGSSPTACATRSASRSGPDRRALDRRRRLGPLGGAQPDPHRPRHRGQLRLALLRGQRAPRQLRNRGPQHLREPLQRRRRHRVSRDDVLPRRSGGAGRGVPERQLVDRPALDFYETGPFPDTYDDALFFADYSRDCIWIVRAGAGGVPDFSTVATFATGAINPDLPPGRARRRALLHELRRRADQADHLQRADGLRSPPRRRAAPLPSPSTSAAPAQPEAPR